MTEEKKLNWKDIEQSIRERMGERILKWFEHNSKRIYVDINLEDLVIFSQYLFQDLGARFIVASGMDTPRGVIEILYHFDFYQLPQVLSLRIDVDKSQPEVESLAHIIKGTEWIEREIAELLGVKFKNHPNPEHLLLPSDWPEGKYPLRRDE